MAKDSTETNLYLKLISKFKPLSKNEEIILLKKAQLGDSIAREKLVQHSLQTVVEIAQEQQSNEMDLFDLIYVGNDGLCQAIDEFDFKKKLSFKAFLEFKVSQMISYQAMVFKFYKPSLN